MPERDSKMCLPCAMRKMKGLPPRACADCAVMNLDPMARIRANAAKPLPDIYDAALKTFAAEGGA